MQAFELTDVWCMVYETLLYYYYSILFVTFNLILPKQCIQYLYRLSLVTVTITKITSYIHTLYYSHSNFAIQRLHG